MKIKNAFLKRIYTDSLYVISATSGNTVISSRADGEALAVGCSFYDIVDLPTRKNIEEHLTNFILRPLLIKTERGPAFVYNYCYPSANLYFAIFPKTDLDSAVYYAKNIAPSESIVLKELDALDPKEPECDEYVANIKSALSLACPVFSNMYGAFIRTDPTDDMKKQAQDLSDLCACFADIKIVDRIGDCDGKSKSEFDFELYSALLCLLLLLARRLSKDRTALVTLTRTNANPLVTVSFEPIKELIAKHAAELSAIMSISERLNLLFYIESDGNTSHITFRPERHDVSLLDLKADLELIFDVGDRDYTRFLLPRA